MAHPVVTAFLKHRTAVRYKLQLPVIFRWTEGSEVRTGAGFTCDVGVDGALIQSSSCPPTGSAIHVEVLIPSPDEGREQLRVQCSGTVTPASRNSGGHSFSVKGLFDDRHIINEIVP
jgi:hypothetical protein